MIKALIVDDNVEFREAAFRFIRINFPQISVIDSVGSVELAKTRIFSIQPELLILDIRLLDGTAFDLLEAVPRTFYLLFTTGYENYARDAFKYSPGDYLVKPISAQALSDALNRACNYLMRAKQFEQPVSNNKQGDGESLWLSGNESTALFELSSIIQCISDARGSTKLTTSDNLTFDFDSQQRVSERLLQSGSFCQISESHIVNVYHVLRFVEGLTAFVELSNGELHEVAPAAKGLLEHHFVKF